MYTTAEIQEYLAEVREQVCRRCVERPPGGPPCAPLGKKCGVELHFPEYLEAIHKVGSPSIVPYLEGLHRDVCSGCACHNGEICPCSLDYLMVLVVQAVETVDERRRLADARSTLSASN